jgi:hypothetical protein
MPKRKQRSNNAKNFPPVPRPGLIEYHGPIPVNASETGIVAVLRDEFALSTGVGTVISGNLDNNPSGTDNWSEYSTSWSEYRVLGIRIEFKPAFSVNTAAVATNTFCSSVLHMAAAPSIVSYGQCFSYGDAKLGHVTKPQTREWRMTETPEAAFIDCAAPTLSSYVYTYYADTLTGATIYGQIFRTWLVQFRNPRR